LNILTPTVLALTSAAYESMPRGGITYQVRSAFLELFCKIPALSQNQLKMNNEEHPVAPSPDRPDRDDTQYRE
jgi:hypothetical protein